MCRENRVQPHQSRSHGCESVRFFRGERLLGLRVGTFYFQVKDMSVNQAYFSERNMYGCRHWTVGHWRFVIRKGSFN